jgi:hypothetical protein
MEKLHFTKMGFVPDDGLKNAGVFPAKPASEEDAREQFQRLLDQLRDAINGLIATLENGGTGQSGAERIGSAPIDGLEENGVSATTLHKQLCLMKGLQVQINEKSVGDDAVTTPKLKDGAVTADKLAEACVTTVKIADGAITAGKFAAHALDGASVGTGGIDADKLAPNAVTTEKIMDGQVTELKLGSNAVTATRLAADAVETAKIKDLNVTEAKLAPSAVTTAKLGIIQSIPLETGSSLTYETATKKLMLNVMGCQPVQLCPVTLGSGVTPPSGIYPAGTLYIQYS